MPEYDCLDNFNSFDKDKQHRQGAQPLSDAAP